MRETEMEGDEVMRRERLTAEMAFKDDAEDASIVIKIRRRLPNFLHSVKLKYIRLGYHYSSFFPSPSTSSLVAFLVPTSIAVLFFYLGPTFAILVPSLVFLYLLRRPSPVYLVDFACYKPSEDNKISRKSFVGMTRNLGVFNDENAEFQERITWRSGLGDETYLPKGILSSPPCLSMEGARREAEDVMFGALDSLFESTGVDPKIDVGIVIVNCSLFNPTPSLSSMIVNHYRMREDVKTFNLGGMGCSAGLISVDLAKDLLRANPNSLAIVVSMENITLNW